MVHASRHRVLEDAEDIGSNRRACHVRDGLESSHRTCLSSAIPCDIPVGLNCTAEAFETPATRSWVTLGHRGVDTLLCCTNAALILSPSLPKTLTGRVDRELAPVPFYRHDRSCLDRHPYLSIRCRGLAASTVCTLSDVSIQMTASRSSLPAMP